MFSSLNCAVFRVKSQGWFSRQERGADMCESDDCLGLYSSMYIQMQVKQCIFKLHVTDFLFRMKRNYNALGIYNCSAKD